MLQTLVLSVPMALLWMIFARQFTVPGFIIGYIFGLGVLVLVRANTNFQEDDEPINLSSIPSQLLWLPVYIVKLTWDTFLSGFDVALRTIRPTMPINPGTARISTMDDEHSSLVSALSAHWITITPGELVIDFEQDEETGTHYLLVHVLDKEDSTQEKLVKEQQERLKLIRRILGRSVEKGGEA